MEDPALRPPPRLAARRGTAPPSSGHARMGRSMSTHLWHRVPSLVLVSGIAAAYWATGRLALLLAMPPGYATAIWPPAGLAFAAILLCGVRVWPGIVLGSFLANVWTAFDPTTMVGLFTSLALPTSLGLGTALQALVGVWLVRRVVGFPMALDQGRQVAAFLGLGGPVSCLIGATWGVTSLLAGGRIPWPTGLVHWWTWWVGDTIGALVVIPLLLVWTAAPRPVWRRRQMTVVLPLGVTFGLVVLFFVQARAVEQARIQRDFARWAHTLADTLQQSFAGYVDALQTIESFYASASEVRRPAFRTFVQRLFARYPGMQALSWDRRVTDMERSAYEAAMRHEGSPAFEITEQNPQGHLVRAAARPEYIAVTYIEPLTGNASAVGYDAASTPERRAALQSACDTGAPRATGRLRLVQETGQHWGLLIFLPLYSTGLPPDTVEARRQHLRGYVTGVFQIGAMMEAALHTFERTGLGLRLEDTLAPVGERLLYSRHWEGPERSWDEAQREHTASLHWRGTIEMAGRQWVLQVTPTLAYLSEHRSWYVWSILTCGMLFVGLLGAFLLVLTGRAVRTDQLVAERTTANAALEREIAARTRMGAALLESEARYRDLFEHAHDMLYIHDLAGHFTALNRRGEQLTGYTRDELLGLPIRHLVAPEHVELLQHMLVRTQAGLPATVYEVDIITKAGQRRTLEVRTQCLAQAGAPCEVQGIARDVTDRTRLEAQLRQAQKMEALGTLAGGIAHDFNNILTAILGYTELALFTIPAESPPWHHLQVVQQAGQRAAALVQQILTFSRRTEPEQTPTQLQLLMQDTLQFLRATLPTTIALHQDLDSRAGMVLADTSQLRQVLLHLCTNAAQAMRETGGALHVRLEAIRLPTADAAAPPSLGAGPYVRLTVQDTGHGMPSEIQERIFEPFFTTKGPGEGTGMGLAVVHGIIASHGGAITVESTPSHGTTVRVYLPESAELPVARARPKAPVSHGHECILFVDDEAALASLGYALLTTLGYEVVAVTSSLEALAVFQTAPARFDLVITDYTMPQLTGEALAQALRGIRPTLPIILCTGFSETMTAEKARALGIDALCLKPVGFEELGKTIRRVLRQRREQREGPQEG
jgi:PAS domain S-box-containing protein